MCLPIKIHDMVLAWVSNMIINSTHWGTSQPLYVIHGIPTNTIDNGNKTHN